MRYHLTDLIDDDLIQATYAIIVFGQCESDYKEG